MADYNKVLLMGNLTRDPELRHTPSNTPVANIGLAVNRYWRNQQGEQQQEVAFIDCEAWSRTAEVMHQYLRKGKPVFIEGRLRLDQWQDKDGGNRSKLKVVIESFQFIDSRDDQGGSGGGGGDGGDYRSQPPANRPAQTTGGSRSAPPPPPDPAADIDGDDIPF